MSDSEPEEVIEGIESEISICEEQKFSAHDDQVHQYVELTDASVETEPRANKHIKEDNVKRSRYSSDLWTKFTILSKKHQVAVCNTCGAKLSFRSTISNLRKHIIRKHGDNKKPCFTSYKPTFKQTVSGRSKLTELDNLILNVVADEEEVEIVGQEVEPSEVQNGVHSYCLVSEEEPVNTQEFGSKVTGVSATKAKSTFSTNYTQSTTRDFATSDRSEKSKRNRILDLQLECLELKRYNMQMETLLLERQLNLPRSLYTENLRGCDNVTRGTQTDVGGGNTKVFYVTDNQGSGREGSQHLFSFQAHV